MLFLWFKTAYGRAVHSLSIPHTLLLEKGYILIATLITKAFFKISNPLSSHFWQLTKT